MPKTLTIKFDWETGTIAADDDNGCLQNEGVKHLLPLIRVVLVAERAKAAIAAAEIALEEARDRLDHERRLASMGC